MRMTEGQRAEIADLAARLDGAARGQAQFIVGGAASAMLVSAQTVWRWLREVRGRSRKRRTDAGHYKTDLPAVMEIARVKEATRRGTRIVSTGRAMSIALADGRIEAAPSEGTVNRILRKKKLMVSGKTFERKIASGPNAMHQYDVTGSKVLYVAGKAGDGDWLLEVRPTKFRRNQAVERLGLWICGLLDDYSRLVHMEYCVAEGESFVMGKEFLGRAWGGDPRCAIRGMPVELNCDFGPIKSSERGRNLMQSLGVAFTQRMPESPNVTGKMENRWAFVFADFELAFGLQAGRTITLREANEELAGWVYGVNLKKHPDFPAIVRLDCYQKGLDPSSIRYMPEEIALGLYTERARVADNFARIQYKNVFYRVPDAWRGDAVDVIEGQDGSLIVRHAETGETSNAPEVAAPTLWGDHRGHKDTPNQVLEKEAAGLSIARSPFTDRPVILHAKVGGDGVIESPLTRHADRTHFVNADEAVDFARTFLGVEPFIADPSLSSALRLLATAVDLNMQSFTEKVLSVVA